MPARDASRCGAAATRACAARPDPVAGGIGPAPAGLERNLVAERVLAAHLEQLRGDEAFDQAEHVGVSAALDLAHQALVGLAERQLADQRQAVGQVLGVEAESGGRG